jgi:hypothetical protein
VVDRGKHRPAREDGKAVYRAKGSRLFDGPREKVIARCVLLILSWPYINARNEQLESGVPGNRHAPFGGGRLEKGAERTSPAAYPTRSTSSNSLSAACMAARTSICSGSACSIWQLPESHEHG